MVFGEIIEPSTRALSEDDYFDIENHTPLEWKDSINLLSKIDTLIISDTTFTNTIIEKSLLEKNKPFSELKNDVAKIYNLGNHKFAILCNVAYNTSIGELTEKLFPWFSKAEQVFAFTSMPASLHQNNSNIDDDICSLRMLSTNTNLNFVPCLETPNLVTGIGANVFSYFIHQAKQSCSIFVGYVNPEPVDSMNSRPFLDLLTKLSFKPTNLCKLEKVLPPNNIYM